jgi:D-alanyl-D-alanine carboxypeptidase (penicillin-binding protein 5/6)
MLRIAFFSLLMTIGFIATPASAYTVDTAAKQAIIIDATTGQVLFEKDADKKMPTSSMSKTMTIYMVFEALKDGRLKLDSELPVSEKAWRMQGSKMFVEVGAMIKVEDLIRGVIVQSGNDATIVLAEGLAGTEEGFASAMTAKARSIGMENSNFANASGWPDPNHYSTPRDLSTLALHLITDFPEDYKYFSETDFTWHGIKQPNRNPLLYRNIGADGIKTGHAEEAGYGLIGSGTRDGRRVVMVLNGMESDKQRAEESARLLDWGLRDFENISFFKAGESVEDAVVVMGKAKAVPLVLDQDLFVTVPKYSKDKIEVKAVYQGPLEAPITKGQEIGKLQVLIPGYEPKELPIRAGADVERLGFFAAAIAKTKLYLTHKITPNE